jgi:hypothetical protein
MISCNDGKNVPQELQGENTLEWGENGKHGVHFMNFSQCKIFFKNCNVNYLFHIIKI